MQGTELNKHHNSSHDRICLFSAFAPWGGGGCNAASTMYFIPTFCCVCGTSLHPKSTPARIVTSVVRLKHLRPISEEDSVSSTPESHLEVFNLAP